MYTSDKTGRAGIDLSMPGTYLTATLCSALFGAVYELFGHGVYSYRMIYAFAFPLLLGLLPAFMLQKRGKPLPGKRAAALIHAGVATLTLGSFLQGVLDIYGTTNSLIRVFWLLGGPLTAAGWLPALMQGARGSAGPQEAAPADSSALPP